jgi:phage repressor protein C with HTH and peptisase S24 domain
MSSQWIALRLKMIGKRQVELAREIGLDPSAVSKLIKGERRLQTDEIAPLAAALQVTGETLLRALREDDDTAVPVSGARGEPAAAPERYIPFGKPSAELDTIPIRSGARAGDEQEMFLEDGPVGYTRRPASLAGIKSAYALYAMGDSMSPRYEAGWILFVNPFKPAGPGRDVVVEKTDGAVLVKQLVRRAGGKVVLRSINPAYKDIEIAEHDIRHIHVITGCDQDG